MKEVSQKMPFDISPSQQKAMKCRIVVDEITDFNFKVTWKSLLNGAKHNNTIEKC